MIRAADKPSVLICVCPHPGYEGKLREVQAGIEEEGIPWTLALFEDMAKAALAWQGASLSRLGVGVGIAPDGMCIHYHRLPAGEPLFSMPDSNNAAVWRYFGYNAARLVKGTPFKAPPQDEPAADAKLAGWVYSIVQKVLQEFQDHEGVKAWSKTP